MRRDEVESAVRVIVSLPAMYRRFAVRRYLYSYPAEEPTSKLGITEADVD